MDDTTLFVRSHDFPRACTSLDFVIPGSTAIETAVYRPEGLPAFEREVERQRRKRQEHHRDEYEAEGLFPKCVGGGQVGVTDASCSHTTHDQAHHPHAEGKQER